MTPPPKAHYIGRRVIRGRGVICYTIQGHTGYWQRLGDPGPTVTWDECVATLRYRGEVREYLFTRAGLDQEPEFPLLEAVHQCPQ